MVFFLIGVLIFFFLRNGHIKFWETKGFKKLFKYVTQEISSAKLIILSSFSVIAFLFLLIISESILDLTLRNSSKTIDLYFSELDYDYSLDEKMAIAKFSKDTCITKKELIQLESKIYSYYYYMEPENTRENVIFKSGRYIRFVSFIEYSFILLVLIVGYLIINVKKINWEIFKRYVLSLALCSSIMVLSIYKTKENDFIVKIRQFDYIQNRIYFDKELEPLNSGIEDLQRKNFIEENDCE